MPKLLHIVAILFQKTESLDAILINRSVGVGRNHGWIAEAKLREIFGVYWIRPILGGVHNGNNYNDDKETNEEPESSATSGFGATGRKKQFTCETLDESIK